MDDKEIEKGFHLVIENAALLIGEAKILFENDRHARAYTLAQLAIEEIGKSTFLTRAILEYYMGQEINIKYFDKLGFRKHQEKTKHSLKPELLAIWMFERSRGEKTELRNGVIEDFNRIDEYNTLKNDSLYVGINDDSFVAPAAIITGDFAKALISKAELRLAAAKPLFGTLIVMKDRAAALKEILDNSEKSDEVNKTLSDEFGVELS